MTNGVRNPGDSSTEEERLARVAGELLRQSADEIDAGTASHLNQARQAALARLTRPSRGRFWLVPAVSAAGVGALVVGLWLWRGEAPPVPDLPIAAVESAADLELLLAGDSLEMLQELDFYSDLAAEGSETEAGTEPGSAG